MATNKRQKLKMLNEQLATIFTEMREGNSWSYQLILARRLKEKQDEIDRVIKHSQPKEL